MQNASKLICLTVLGVLCACSSSPPSTLVTGPTTAKPNYMAIPLGDRNPGAIFQPDTAELLYEESIAHRVGDILTITIAENVTGSNTSTVTTSQASTEATKGPGALASMNGFLKTLFNVNFDGSASTSLKSSGANTSASAFTGSLTVTIVDLLPNGNYVVGGDKRVSLDNNEYTLRFSGIVNKRDIQSGNVVSSNKVADARIEKVGQGLVTDANSLGWMQRFFLSVMGFN